MMKKANAIIYAFKETHKLENKLLPETFALAVASGVMPFVNIWFSAKTIDLIEMGSDAKKIITYICCAVGINFVLFFFSKYLNDSYYMHRTTLYNQELKNIASKLFSLDFKKIEDSNFKELLHKHTEAQNRVFSSFVQFTWLFKDFLSGAFTVIISIIILLPLFRIGFQKTGNSFFEKPAFILSIFCAIAVMVVIMLIVATRMNKQWFIASDEYSRLDKIFYYFINIFSDYNTGKEIRLYKEQDIIEKTATHRILNEGEQILKKVSMNSAKSSSFIAILGSVVGFGVYLFIGVKGLYGLFGIGSLVLYCGSFMQIINGIMKLAVTFGQAEEMVPLVNYYYEIMNTKDDMIYGEKEIDLAAQFKVEFKDVSFKYPGNENYALENINLTISGGEHLAVVGRNGSGKTTFIKLMCRLYDVDSGEILINGINIKEYSKDSLMKLYSVVFQDFKLFAIPICDNIFADKEHDKDNLYRCLEQANIKDRVERMNKKENTYLYKNLDKNGVDISGGEAQKLALARALYKDSPLVILDEPTAALDPVAENEIYSRFNFFTENKTAIYISHRLSSCIFCDRIAVFDQSNLVEEGTHEELLQLNGKYSELWEAQAQYYVLIGAIIKKNNNGEAKN